MNAATDPALSEYYGDPHVQARLLEYCGSEGTDGPTAAFVTGLDPSRQPYPTWQNSRRVSPSGLEALCMGGCDVARSLWDRRALIFVLDLDYQNLDYPTEPLTHASDVFFKLESVLDVVHTVLSHFRLPALTLATGRGYHVVGRIPLDDAVVPTLATLAAMPSWYQGFERRRPAGVALTISAQQARAAAGLTLILEYLAQMILQGVVGRSLIPVVLNGTAVGSGLVGRECLSIDFSHGGDPLDIRCIRTAFSAYQWHRARPDIFGAAVAALPPLAALPRRDVSLATFLIAGRTLRTALRVARDSTVALPNMAAGIERVLRDYQGSRLSRFHAGFAAECQTGETPPPVPDVLAPCLVRPLRQPNDLLLKPEYIQNLVRGLLAHGWRASQVAALVYREYMHDHGWRDRWVQLDARTRAEFDVRVFAGMVVTGVDELIDFNCRSSQEKWICPFVGCRHDLREDRDRLRARYLS